MKLEIGSGMNPQQGYIHLDVDPKFPHVEIVCDVSKERIPLDDESCEEVLASHVIEHLPWRTLPGFVKEIDRVLKPNGVAILRTPDLEFIAKSYLEKKITPEWPDDEKALRKVFGEITESEWAIVKLFSGQDYLSNFHQVCFDFNSIKRLFEHNTSLKVKKIKLPNIISPGELQIACVKIKGT